MAKFSQKTMSFTMEFLRVHMILCGVFDAFNRMSSTRLYHMAPTSSQLELPDSNNFLAATTIQNDRPVNTYKITFL